MVKIAIPFIFSVASTMLGWGLQMSELISPHVAIILFLLSGALFMYGGYHLIMGLKFIKSHKQRKILIIILAVLIFLAVIYLSFLTLKNKKEQNTSPMNSIGSIANNQGIITQGQVGNNTQVINQQRKIKKQFVIRKESLENEIHTIITLGQTDGIWSEGESFKLQIEYEGGPITKYIISGFPETGFSHIRDRLENPFYYETWDAPVSNQSIIIQLISLKDIQVKGVAVAPQ